MKYLKIVSLILSALFLFSCASYQGRVKTNVTEQNELVVTPELRALLAVNPKPKFVIRVPNPPSNVTAAEKFNTYINAIEKTFMQVGFVVRDRALLENLMKSGNADYQSIKNTIDTDLILDILSLEFELPNNVGAFYNITKKRDEKFATPENFINCQKAKLECRVTIVEKGQMGGLFTLYFSPCDSGQIVFLVTQTLDSMKWPNKNAWFPQLTMGIGEEIKSSVTQLLTVSLLDNLIQARVPATTSVDFGDRRTWRIVRVDSEETSKEDGRGRNVLDGNGRTYWHTEWSAQNPRHPHEIVIDLGQSRTMTGFRYLPRQDESNGRIREYEFYVTNDLKNLGQAVAHGTFPNGRSEQNVRFATARTGRYICLRALS
jgi:hypothetical protein